MNRVAECMACHHRPPADEQSTYPTKCPKCGASTTLVDERTVS